MIDDANTSINAGIAENQRIEMLEKLEERFGEDEKGQVLIIYHFYFLIVKCIIRYYYQALYHK